jgi:hypothetical protein
MTRKADDVANAIASVQLDEGWLQQLLEVEPDNLALILGEIANTARISSSTLKKARTSLPSFSDAKWNDFAEQFGLPLSPTLLQLKNFETPVYRLPMSFHEQLVQMAWRSQDVYREI